MSHESAIRVLVLPVFKRCWLWHAWKDAPAQTAALKPWQQGADLQEKLKLVMGSLQRWGMQMADEQWQKLATADEGSFNNRLFKLARTVLSQVDPNESFLKILPQQVDVLQFRYPSSLPERLIRRRLRLLAAKAQPFHASRLRLWCLALLPQVPLIPLPLPNITIYFTIWRIISNRSAGKGAAALSSAMDALSDVQRLKLAQDLQQLQQQGIQLRPGSWAEQLVDDINSLQHRVEAEVSGSHTGNTTSSSSSSSRDGQQPEQGQQQQQEQQQQQRRLPLPVFIADAELDKLVLPSSRLSSPLPEAAVEQLMQLYHQPHLLEHYRAACKKSGARDFPAQR